MGIETPEAGLVAPNNAPWCLDPGIGVQALAEIQAAVRSPGEIRDILVGVPESETCKDDFSHVGPAIAIGVSQKEQVGAFANVNPAGTEREPGRHVETTGKDGRLVGFPVAIGVLENKELVVRFLAGGELGRGQRRQHPEPALLIPVHGDRVGDAERFVGEEAGFEILVEFERSELSLGRRIGSGGLDGLARGGTDPGPQVT